VPGFGVRYQAVIGLWHFSQRNRKRNKVSFTLGLIMPDDTPGLKNGKLVASRNRAEESNQDGPAVFRWRGRHKEFTYPEPKPDRWTFQVRICVRELSFNRLGTRSFRKVFS
jgi:hypothetical protein